MLPLGKSNLVYWVPLWPIIFTVIWAVWNSVRDSLDAKLVERSLAWPEVQGKVVSSKVVWAHVEVTFVYSISSGHCIGKYKMNLPVSPPDRWGRTANRMNEVAKQTLADFPTGGTVIIRYNPQRPAQSVFYHRGEISTAASGSDSKVCE
jgi:hypothetical protein